VGLVSHELAVSTRTGFERGTSRQTRFLLSSVTARGPASPGSDNCVFPKFLYLDRSPLFFLLGMYGSIPRFDLVMFPLFLVLALIGIHSRAFHLGYCILSSMLAALFMMMHSQWNWVA